MGTTSDKLTYLSGTKDKLKEVINYAGANITNDTFRSYPEKLFNKYIDILNQGISELYNNLPKVTGQGEILTLNDTVKAPMKVLLKGNTSQSILPTEYTQVDYIESSGTQYIDLGYKYNANDNIEIKFVPLEENVDKALFGAYQGQDTGFCELGYYANKLRGNISESRSPIYTIGTIYECKLINGKWNYNNSPFGAEKNITMTSNCYLFGANHSGATKLSSNRVYSLKMKRNNNVINNFIPCYRNSDNEVGLYDLVTNTFLTNAGTGTFTYGSVAPTPSSPIPINVVSGDNEVVVCGKNRFDKSKYQNLDTNYDYENPYRCKYIKLKSNTTYTCSFNAGTTFANALLINNKSQVNSAGFLDLRKASDLKTFTTDSTGNLYIGKYGSNNTDLNERINTCNLQIVEGQYTSETIPPYEPYQSQTYPINLGELKLCKIGDYQDYFTKNTGKNLFDKDNVVKVENKILNDSGVEINDTGGAYTKMYMPVKPNTTYTTSGMPKNGTDRVYYFDSNKTFIERTSGYTNLSSFSFTTPANCYFIDIQYYMVDNNFNTWQIEEGSSASTYEPYGTGQWCKYNSIGKVVLDGSESYTATGLAFLYSIALNPAINSALSSYYTYSNSWSSSSADYRGKMNFSSGKIRFMPLDSTIDTEAKFKTWLSTHNTDLYYPLATPYLSLIEDETLISQLDNIENAMSYEGQTNISQVNDDKPFIIEAIAIKQF